MKEIAEVARLQFILTSGNFRTPCSSKALNESSEIGVIPWVPTGRPGEEQFESSKALVY